MNLRDAARAVPATRKLSLLRQRLDFSSSVSYWERHYSHGGTSGDGSYGPLGIAKAGFMNEFVRSNNLTSVIEFGCGDGHQLSLADYPSYIGLDVSRAAVELCKLSFANDRTKSFFLYDGACFADNAGLFRADLAISLDVIFHLVEDSVFDTYMMHLFAAGGRYVIIYSTDREIHGTAPHVRHRRFSSWVESKRPEWQLATVVPGPNPVPCRADFFVYRLASADPR